MQQSYLVSENEMDALSFSCSVFVISLQSGEVPTTVDSISRIRRS